MYTAWQPFLLQGACTVLYVLRLSPPNLFRAPSRPLKLEIEDFVCSLCQSARGRLAKVGVLIDSVHGEPHIDCLIMLSSQVTVSK